MLTQIKGIKLFPTPSCIQSNYVSGNDSGFDSMNRINKSPMLSPGNQVRDEMAFDLVMSRGTCVTCHLCGGSVLNCITLALLGNRI